MQLKMVNSHKKKRTPFRNNDQAILPDDGKRKKPSYSRQFDTPIETAALISEPPFLCVYTIL